MTPEGSVVDGDHRVWGMENRYVADGRMCPIQGSADPPLTIMALVSRLAQAAEQRKSRCPGERISVRPRDEPTPRRASR